eukprot:3587610-Rhodomonas_salina.1
MQEPHGDKLECPEDFAVDPAIHDHIDEMKHALGVVFLNVRKELLERDRDCVPRTPIPKRFLTNVSPADVNPSSTCYELNDIKQDQQVNIDYCCKSAILGFRDLAIEKRAEILMRTSEVYGLSTQQDAADTEQAEQSSVVKPLQEWGVWWLSYMKAVECCNKLHGDLCLRALIVCDRPSDSAQDYALEPSDPTQSKPVWLNTAAAIWVAASDGAWETMVLDGRAEGRTAASVTVSEVWDHWMLRARQWR